METYQLVMVAGVAIGIIVRTLGPYLAAMFNDGAKFEFKYLVSAVVSAFVGVAGGSFVLPIISPDMPWIAALWLGITTGYAVQSASRHLEKSAGAP